MDKPAPPDYPRVGPEHPEVYKHIQALKALGLWACDALDHNENDGCSNPECFKWNHGVVAPRDDL